MLFGKDLNSRHQQKRVVMSSTKKNPAPAGEDKGHMRHGGQGNFNVHCYSLPLWCQQSINLARSSTWEQVDSAIIFSIRRIKSGTGPSENLIWVRIAQQYSGKIWEKQKTASNSGQTSGEDLFCNPVYVGVVQDELGRSQDELVKRRV